MCVCVFVSFCVCVCLSVCLSVCISAVFRPEKPIATKLQFIFNLFDYNMDDTLDPKELDEMLAIVRGNLKPLAYTLNLTPKDLDETLVSVSIVSVSELSLSLSLSRARAHSLAFSLTHTHPQVRTRAF